MKGVRTFPSQSAGLRYFVNIIMEAISCGRDKAGVNIKITFIFQMSNFDNYRGCGNDDFLKDLCNIALPILGFYRSICGFDWMEYDIKEKGSTIIGSALWEGRSTDGRFVRLVFHSDGSCEMFYDLGYKYHTDEPEEKDTSTFLNLPCKGDREITKMSRNEFRSFALAQKGEY